MEIIIFKKNHLSFFLLSHFSIFLISKYFFYIILNIFLIFYSFFSTAWIFSSLDCFLPCMSDVGTCPHRFILYNKGGKMVTGNGSLCYNTLSFINACRCINHPTSSFRSCIWSSLYYVESVTGSTLGSVRN